MCPKLPHTIEERIADNRAQTVADSVRGPHAGSPRGVAGMYREALATAAEARGWSVHWYFRFTADNRKIASLTPILVFIVKVMGFIKDADVKFGSLNYGSHIYKGCEIVYIAASG